MIFVILFDVFYLVVMAWALMRAVTALRCGVAQYRSGRFSRDEKPIAFWMAVASYATLVVGSVYGIAVAAGM
jgi:hypothetical protein